MTDSRNSRKVRTGVVTSVSGAKTIVVTITERKRHPKYGKMMTSSKKLHAHDEECTAGVGDTVRVMETRPMSKMKRWRLIEVVERAKGYAAESGTTFKQVNTMAEAFEGADIVIPKSWAPFAAMEKRTNLYAEGDDAGIAALEKELLAQNATHQDWCSTTELMEKTANGQDTIFMHPLPADISGVSCEHGEVNADVFDMHRVGMYKEASYKPYAIAAMMFLQKVADPAAALKALDERNTARWFQA